MPNVLRVSDIVIDVQIETSKLLMCFLAVHAGVSTASTSSPLASWRDKQGSDLIDDRRWPDYVVCISTLSQDHLIDITDNSAFDWSNWGRFVRAELALCGRTVECDLPRLVINYTLFIVFILPFSPPCYMHTLNLRSSIDEG